LLHGFIARMHLPDLFQQRRLINDHKPRRLAVLPRRRIQPCLYDFL
jgi:hypothetical protein